MSSLKVLLQHVGCCYHMWKVLAITGSPLLDPRSLDSMLALPAMVGSVVNLGEGFLGMLEGAYLDYCSMR